MRYLPTKLAICLFTLTAPVFASTTPGGAFFGDEVLQDVNVEGPVVLQGTTVTQSLLVIGPLSASRAQLNEVTIQGAANLSECTIAGPTKIYGNLTAHQVKFKSELNLWSQHAALNEVTAGAITVGAITDYSGTQQLKLTGKTVVTGPIKFESGKGRVVVEQESMATFEVIGGKVTVLNPFGAS